MTDDHIRIPARPPSIQYAADGQQREFFYPFPIFETGDLEIFVDGTLQTDDFTVTGVGLTQGGKVTFETAPADGAVVTLRRNVPVQRTTDFQEGGAFRARVINDELDRMTAQIQQIGVEAGRGLKLPPTDPEDSLTVPIRADRLGKLLGFDDAGRPVAEVTPGAVLQADQRAQDAETARDQAVTARQQAQGHQVAASNSKQAAEAARDQAAAALATARIELADQTEAEAGADNAKLMTPLRTKQAVTAQVVKADQAEAEAGADNAKLMTPLRTKQAFDSRITVSTADPSGGGDGDLWLKIEVTP